MIAVKVLTDIKSIYLPNIYFMGTRRTPIT